MPHNAAAIVTGFLGSRFTSAHYRGWHVEHQLDVYLATTDRFDLLAPHPAHTAAITALHDLGYPHDTASPGIVAHVPQVRRRNSTARMRH